MVLTIILLLFFITLPNVRYVSIQQDKEMLFDNLSSALHLAKNQALFDHKMVIVCASQDQKNCGGSWSDGFIVTTRTTNTQPMPTTPYYFPGSRYAAVHFLSFGPSSQVIQISPGGHLYQNGTFLYCLKNHPPAALIINKEAGRPRIEWQTTRQCPTAD